ncbi:MAG: branched-chain amino acid ABC transporter permease, partial [Actinomycetota bacterium]
MATIAEVEIDHQPDDGTPPGPRPHRGSSLADSALAAWRHPLAGPLLKAVVGYVVLVEGVVQLLFGRIDIPNVDLPFLEHSLSTRGEAIPRGVFLQGAVIGSLYALVATGLILVYRANRIINFAQAQLGAVPAVLALLLLARNDWPYLAVVPIVLVGGALLGGVTETTLIRRFSSSPRLILTVVTIGVGYLLLVLEFFTKRWIVGDLADVLSLRFPTPFQDINIQVGVANITGDHIAAVAVTGVLVAALAAFFKYTDIGIAVRASAENGERASLLGIPVKRVSTIVWMLAATLSAIGIFLRTPLVGLPLQG